MHLRYTNYYSTIPVLVPGTVPGTVPGSVPVQYDTRHTTLENSMCPTKRRPSSRDDGGMCSEQLYWYGKMKYIRLRVVDLSLK
jgi:hypothetical protein